MPTNYKELRSAYDLAFREFARQLQSVVQLQNLDEIKSNNLVTAGEQLASAECYYLKTRNALASYLLLRQAEVSITLAAQPATDSPRQQRSAHELAEFLWESAGKPASADQAHWYAKAAC